MANQSRLGRSLLSRGAQRRGLCPLLRNGPEYIDSEVYFTKIRFHCLKLGRRRGHLTYRF